jgi:hypothetical protein
MENYDRIRGHFSGQLKGSILSVNEVEQLIDRSSETYLK